MKNNRENRREASQVKLSTKKQTKDKPTTQKKYNHKDSVK